MKNLRRTALLLIVALCTISLCSCGGEEEKKNTGNAYGNINFQGKPKTVNICHSCNKSGLCYRCGGKGIIYSASTPVCQCQTCHGTGICQKCGGDGVTGN